MSYDLFFADSMFSSWSLRGWLLLEKFNLEFTPHLVGLYAGTMAQDLAALAPARLVPVLRLPCGTVVGETLAIAETLAERHPEAGHWPADPALRATARWLCAEMASGFMTLRTDCPMQLREVVEGFEPSTELRADLNRLETLWAHARACSGAAEGWLFGSYSAADVFFAPVAARIIGYDLPVSEAARAYCAQHIADPSFLRWRAEAKRVRYDPEPYVTGLPTRPWPGDR